MRPDLTRREFLLGAATLGAASSALAARAASTGRDDAIVIGAGLAGLAANIPLEPVDV